MNISFTGRIIAKGQIQMGTSKKGTQWSSCEYTIEELNQQYPARAVFQVFGSDNPKQLGSGRRTCGGTSRCVDGRCSP